MKKSAQSDFRQAHDQPDLVTAGKGEVLLLSKAQSSDPCEASLFNTFRWQNLILWNEI